MTAAPVPPPLDQSAPFDGAAPSYDATFTDTTLGRRLRAIAWSWMDRAFRPGDRVLELGCGSGADAIRLAERGIAVTATDASVAMRRLTADRAVARDAKDLVRVAALDLRAIGDPGWVDGLDGPFDGVVSDFGALNCVQDRARLLGGLAQAVRPGGHVLLVAMGPMCPLETGWHVLHGEPEAAVRRWRAGAVAAVAGGAAIRVWYPSAHRVATEAAPWFHERGRGGIGVALPPSGLAAAFERRGTLLSLADLAERRLGPTRFGARFGDHWVLHLERRTDA